MREDIDKITTLPDVFKKDSNSLVYLEFMLFDLPEINSLHIDTPANDFFNAIGEIDEDEYWQELIAVEGCKSLINIRWDKIKAVAMNKLFWPYVLYLWMF
jgi:hypothetical protein